MPRRPEPSTRFNEESVSRALRKQDRWLLWEPQKNDTGRFTKVPINPNAPRWARQENTDRARKARRLGSSIDPATWTTFEHAVKIARRGHLGIGFALEGSGLVGIDLDHVIRDDGSLEPWAEAAVASLDSYTEVSPSGDGLRIFAFGEIPRALNLQALGLEMYSTGRYLTVTGERWHGASANVEPRPEAVLTLFETYAPEQPEPPASGGEESLMRTGSPTRLDGAEILRAIAASKQADKFAALYAGSNLGYPSASEADAALAMMLAFWCANDEARIEQVMLASGRVREKWFTRRGELTYLQYTVRHAIVKNTQVYEPRKSRPLSWGQKLTRRLAEEAAAKSAAGER